MMIDLNIWPWIERLPGFMAKLAPELCPSESIYPNLYAWIQRMLKVPAVKATMFNAESHIRFSMSYINGKPDYDFGLDP